MTFGGRFCFSRKGGIGGSGWVHQKGAVIMAVSGLHLGNTLACSEWATAVLLCTKRVKKTVLSPCMVPISGRKALIPAWASGCQLSAIAIASTLMGGCGLSHECVEDGYKSTWGLKTQQNWGYGKLYRLKVASTEK